ncbi:hypothetical protein LCGC14_1308450 [marine sediment metagenome]|uniref:Uncharacterized protein n=1 Tax=marine sediment metagenome TaxID=412755 RepID=A0A0F9N474_9ZZZZ
MILYNMEQVNKNLLVFLFVGVFLLTSISAELVFKQNTDVDLKIVCINAGFCSSTTDCNVSVFDPNENVLLDGVKATQAASLAYHNVTIIGNLTQALGEYRVGGFCKDGSVTELIDFTFLVTPSGLANLFNFYTIILLISAVVIFFGFWIRDPWIVMFGTFGLYFVGLFFLLFGIVGVKDTTTTYAISIIILGIAGYISIKTGIEVFNG